MEKWRRVKADVLCYKTYDNYLWVLAADNNKKIFWKYLAPCARFKVLTAVSLRVRVFLDVMPCHRVRHSFVMSGGTQRLTQWHISEYWNSFDITLESHCLQTVFLTVLSTLPQGESLCIGLKSSVTMYFQKTSLSQMLYLSDNLAYFPYQVQDEPLFIIHHIDIMISVSGTNLLQSFREVSIS